MNEEWRTIPDWPQYAVSSIGRVKRITGGKGATPGTVLKYIVSHLKPYKVVMLHVKPIRKHMSIHRLVAIAFLGKPPTPKHQCNHKNGDKMDNRVENLEWVTHKENGQHAYKHGLTPKPPNAKGQDSPRAILTNIQAQEILDTPCTHGSTIFLAKKFGISESNVHAIRHRLSWKYLTPKQDPPPDPSPH